MKQAEYEIINTAERLLSDKKIDLFIGYEKGDMPLRASPLIVSQQKDARRLVWNSYCSNNLSVYLPRLMSKTKEKKSMRVGILCKGCDSRSIVELIKEKQVVREDLFIVGVSCSGIIDVSKILSQLKGEEVTAVDENEDKVIIKLKNGERILEKKDYLCPPCLNCTYPTPTVYDILIRAEKYTPQVTTPDLLIENFMAKPREERWRIFEKEISKCIRCYACRNACPNCYCKECFAEQTKPKWLGVTSEVSDLVFYHIVRIFHQAGRCVDCGACSRACPMNINLRLFTRMLVDEVKERYGYEAGISIKDQPLLALFQSEDKQDFMTDPE